jgi:Ca-activated chloride channel family protein
MTHKISAIFIAMSCLSTVLVAATLSACGLRDRYVPAIVAGSSEARAGAAPGEPAPVAPAAERYDQVSESDFRLAREQPLSTFSVDVDTASYSNVRRFLMQGQRPPRDAVRIEELINYFPYDLPKPGGEHPIAVTTELTDSPFAGDRKLLRVALRASAPRDAVTPPRNLVFLIDVSGSMQDENKLPLLKAALALLVEQLDARDRVAIVTYAGSSGVVLPPTSGAEHARILEAIDALDAGGATAGAAGITTAYALAREQLRPDAINRVLLATDGDFNVGVSDRAALVRLIEREREHGVFLTVLGFGTGNLQDATLEQLADHGNGSYGYIDTLREARKLLATQASSTLRTVAKDTKVQVELNPARVLRYRLIGYENRRLQDADFDDDAKDAGDMGDGHAVTALYELELSQDGALDDDLLDIRVRYEQPQGGASRMLETTVSGAARRFEQGSDDLRFAAAVAAFGMWLQGSSHVAALGLEDVRRMASGALGDDSDGYRREFLELVALAEQRVPTKAARD